MDNIVYTRVDDRLVHGQVMTGWVRVTGANHVLIIDDQVAKDTFMIMMMKQAMPNLVSLHATTIDETREYLKNKGKNKKIIILVKTPVTIRKLWDAGVKIESVGVGGMATRGNRTKLYRNIAADAEERTALKELNELGVDVYFQVTPDNSKVRLDKVKL
ncbi:PTS sugar transporter subunit IIB [Amphibacillus sp. Q70]|uniref:PTS sugar transporter subunit IIB n=1 Tax=Amphibacillus sp. Q70 TaxID=3453416 RepID=UPI003F871F82